MPRPILVAEGPTAEDVLDALTRTKERGAPTLTLTDSSRTIPGEVLRLPGNDEEWLSPIPTIVVAQLFTHWLAIHQGNDPDNPRGLEKVTRTT